jgi:hypothetical protein
VLNLQARVDFEEVEAPRVGIEHELDRASRFILHGLAKTDGTCVQRCALLSGQTRCRSFLNHFLIAPLHRAVAFAQCNYAATAIAEDLHLDMPRVLNELFQVDTRIREVRFAEPRD